MNGRISFYLDEHVHPAVATGLRQRDVDVLTTREANLLSAPDEAHLALALTQGRVIFTQDIDFLRLHTAGYKHAGIVYVGQQTPIGYIIRGLMLVYQILSPEEMENRVEFL